MSQYRTILTPATILSMLLLLTTGLFAQDGEGNGDGELQFPLRDRSGDFVNDEDDNPFDLEDPSNVERSVEYDPETGMYVVTERIGDSYYRPPTYMTYEEYMKYVDEQQWEQYWKERSEAVNLIERDNPLPPIETKSDFLGDIFGGTTIDIRPQGNVEITLGGNVQKIANPALPARVQKQGGFDFDMDINLNVVGKIGDKMQLNVRYNTQASFNFDNQIKLEYAGDEDEIIKKIEAGDVALPLPTQLITGSQRLFGILTELQFGKLTMTSVISQNKSKKQSVILEGGAQKQNFEVMADQYDANRHYFLAQYFRDNYENALADPVNINSLVNITEVEVWVTNRTGATQNVRDVVGFMDLGEPDPYSPIITSGTSLELPRNEANSLYGSIEFDSETRKIDNVTNNLQSQYGLTAVQDFEKTYAKKLNNSEYTLDPQLGYISLNTTLQPNEVLAVAFKYTYNGQEYQVGEFAREVTNEEGETNEVLYLKMLKSTSVRPQLPIWDLMMKNVYSLGAFQISEEDFYLDIYYADPGGGLKRYIPKGQLAGQQLIRVLNMDRLNTSGDPIPDGIFDFVPGSTINPNRGRIYFPVLEPFGSSLRDKFESAGEPALADQYVYDQLYDSTKVIAQQYPEFNRFVIKGTYKASSGRDISLGAFNIPQGSVTVSLGGQRLTEGVDYSVDYNLGRVTILNEALLTSGGQIKIDFENDALFGFQVKSLYGTRLDYRVSDKLTLGGTVMKLTERPFTEKVNVGEDPISNTIMGLDVTYNTEAPFITKVLDKLPIYDTKEMSLVNLYAEVAHLKPGHSKAIGDEGTVYLDDFEGTSSGYDLKFPATSWRLASTPNGAPDENGNILFPEADNFNDLSYGYNRAKLAWYNIDALFLRNNSATPDYIKDDPEQYITHYTREVRQDEVFPNKDAEDFNNTLLTFDLAYFPDERGPYNYVDDAANVNTDGTLTNPEDRWGGIMRSIDNNDFEASNIEYIEFWVMDPFFENPDADGGDLYINLGTISEDILKDSKQLFENGLDSDPNKVQSSVWGLTPKIPPITNSFDNDADDRALQDVGYDGIDDFAEQDNFSGFLTGVGSVVDPAASAILNADPSSDNFTYYRDETFDDNLSPIIDRYKQFNGPDGNSPVIDPDASFASSGTNVPDAEDLNRDNTLNENEEYFQYRVPVFPGMDVSNHPYIVNVQSSGPIRDDYNDIDFDPINWYQFKIPIRQYDDRVGNIQDFKSIQYIRMFLTDFEEDVVMRFATFDLVRNQWRTYLQSLEEPGDNVPVDNFGNTTVSVSSVSIEENSEKEPVNYVLPPDIEREETLGSQTNRVIQQNEQSLSVVVCGLEDGDSRAVYKNLGVDVRKYDVLKMYMHAEEVEPVVDDQDVTGFIRLGADFRDNYYQYEVPLYITDPGSYDNNILEDRQQVWPDTNAIELVLADLVDLKLERDAAGVPLTTPYTIVDERGNLLTIVGNPDLGSVQTAMLGVKNPAKEDPLNPLTLDGEADDGLQKCVEVWFNELRLQGLEESGGTAAVASLDVKLADLGNVGFSTAMHTIGFGQIEQKVDERFKDTYYQYDFTTSLELGKLLPEGLGLRIPFYATVAQSFSTPEYDPYALDIPLKQKLDQMELDFGKDSTQTYKRQTQDIETRKGFNFTNVKFIKQGKGASMPWDPSNFTFTYAYNVIEYSNPFLEYDREQNYLGSIGYNYSPQPKYIYPFKKMIKSKSKYYDIIKDVNFNLIPSSFGFNTQMRRKFGELQLRQLGNEKFRIDPSYDKSWYWDRNYTFKYNPFKSLSIDYGATNNAKIDEPEGKIDTDEKKQEVWNNIKDWGRNTRFTQTLGLSYSLPIDKIPVLDWVKVKTNYNSNFSWTANSLQLDPSGSGELIPNTRGNDLSNAQNIRVNGDFSMDKLYDKVEFLKPYNSPKGNIDREKDKKQKENIQKARADIQKNIDKAKDELKDIKDDIKAIKKGDDLTKEEKKTELEKLKLQKKQKKDQIKKLKKDKRKKQPPVDPLKSIVLQPLLSVKKVSISYSDNSSTVLPGYMPETNVFGQDLGMSSPGMGFAFGKQPGNTLFGTRDDAARDLWLEDAAGKGWISTDTLLNRQFVQTNTRNLDASVTIEPWRDIRIDLSWTKNYSETYSELFKVVEDGDPFQHLNPSLMGSYTISNIAWGSLFKPLDSDGLSEVYTAFEENRLVVTDRLAEENPNSTQPFYVYEEDPVTGELVQVVNPDYNEGYGPKSQEVLIPSFIAAYEGKDVNKIGLNPFKYVPKPNWRLTYSGLTKFKWASKIFSKFTLSHGYSSTMTVSSFQTDQQYTGNGDITGGSNVDSLSGNFYSLYNIPSIIINEQLSPLIGVDMTFKNGLNAKFDYKKSRTVSMSFIDYQLTENKSTTVTVGMGYKIKGLVLPFKNGDGKNVKLDNDLNFRFDFSFRDNVVVNHRLDQNISEPTSGNRTISIQPSIDYTINKQLNIRLFFDRTKTIPKTSASFPQTNTAAGVKLRFTLAP